MRFNWTTSDMGKMQTGIWHKGMDFSHSDAQAHEFDLSVRDLEYLRLS
jgi:hypothetical protein